MVVKSQPKTQSQPSVEEDLQEVTALLGTTLSALRTATPPPPELSKAIEKASLQKRHMPALLAVTAAGPISVSELASRLGLLLSSTSTIVGDLSRAGLLERAEDDEDRRRTIVRVHEDYREAMEAWLAVAVSPVRNALQRLSPQARRGFMEGWRFLQEESTMHATCPVVEDDEAPAA